MRNKQMLRTVALVLFLSMITPILAPTVAFARVEREEVTSNDIQRAGEYGWKAFFKAVKWLIVRADNKSFSRSPVTIDKGGNWAASSSGTVAFGNKNTEVRRVKFTTKVSTRNNKLDVFAQTSPTGWLKKITIFIENSAGREIEGGQVTHNQHIFTNSNLPLGSYTTYYVFNGSRNWDCWIYQYDFTGTRSSMRTMMNDDVEKVDTVFNPETNKSYILPKDNSSTGIVRTYALGEETLNAQNLFDEFKDDELNLFVNRLKNYNIDDDLYVEDVITDLKYDNGVTEVYFGNTEDGPFIWPFAGDLRDRLKVGEIAKFKFKVVEEFATKGYVFETLDYFLESYDHINLGTAANIDDFLVR